ncbi:MAG: hypothetical protein HZA19_06900, partial [Nitrospirae bacterium]|nr:hypothetical protein [Nitrospirota bacterium]
IPWEERRTISGILIHSRDGKGWTGGPWTVTLSYLTDIPQPESEALPGVSLKQWERVPDTDHPLDVDADNPVGDIESQIRELNRSGLLGNLDAAKFENKSRGFLEWVIKTHAGNQEERTRWMKDIGAMK